MTKRILVVDDDADFREVLRDTLTAAGYAVVPLDQPAGIVAALEAHHPDLVVLDWWMPELDGGAVAAVMRSLGYQVPIVFITALAEHNGSLNGHAVLAKPVSLSDLRTTVTLLIGPP